MLELLSVTVTVETRDRLAGREVWPVTPYWPVTHLKFPAAKYPY